MRFELLEAPRAGDPRELAAELRALVPGGSSVAEPVARIIAAVRERGDEAVEHFTRTFDTEGGAPGALEVDPEELHAAAAALDPAVRHGLEQAIANVSSVAEAGLREPRTVSFAAHEVTLRSAPVGRAAVYVPGGRAPYPSTVVMGVTTARIAGVESISVCAPPDRSGEIHPVVLAACRLTGASRVYRMGGAQAVAALAYGTASVQPVDVIVGPGNLYVQEAKRQVTGQVGIDGFAGPSDLVAVFSAGADPRTIALDLLAQAEHGPGTLVVGISPERDALEAIAGEAAQVPETGAIGRLVHVAGSEAALALAEALAPEHLQLAGADAEALAPRVSRAGSLFVGAPAGAAFGDYIAGSNHVLPTGGAARFASALSPNHFRRGFTEVRITDASSLAQAAAPLARAEGFELHARSMEARIRDNRDQL